VWIRRFITRRLYKEDKSSTGVRSCWRPSAGVLACPPHLRMLLLLPLRGASDQGVRPRTVTPSKRSPGPRGCACLLCVRGE
jgi:hypothetical protein